ncbi:putative quinol monooxygenase [Nitratireductor sp. XY-223]|uniref:putative quinol monooxygenase n=1 Tax=Nitratireductor sp. XY-223 TaxID=2561926 RepID=UPI00198161E0|nr:putative quinol monooxygenase [Nitratireductor sp. XY-223]
MSEPVMVFASFRPKKGTEKTVEQILRGMVRPTRDEPGNLVYDLYEQTNVGHVAFHLFEKYVDGPALEAHRESDHYKQYRATILKHLDEPISVCVLSAVDVV